MEESEKSTEKSARPDTGWPIYTQTIPYQVANFFPSYHKIFLNFAVQQILGQYKERRKKPGKMNSQNTPPKSSKICQAAAQPLQSLSLRSYNLTSLQQNLMISNSVKFALSCHILYF